MIVADGGGYSSSKLNEYASRMPGGGGLRGSTASRGTPVASANEPMVYFGSRRIEGVSPMDSWGRTRVISDVVPASQAIAGFSMFEDEDYDRIKKLTGSKSPRELENWWAWAVEQSANALALGRKITPWDVLEKYARRDGGAIGGAGSGSGPRTQVSKSVNLTDPETAKGIALAAIRQAIGRRPTDDEIAQFRSALNSLERQNPTITKTTIDGEGNSSSTTTGGAPNPSAFAETYIDENMNADVDIYRAMTEYADAMRLISQPIV